jgi:hypothetical protein
MLRSALYLFALLSLSLSDCLFAPSSSLAQAINVVSSEHMLVRLPIERDALGRDLIGDLERCYLFMNGATGGKLPRKIVLIADWDQTEDSCNPHEAKIVIGMNKKTAAVDETRFFLHSAAREIGRLGLLQTSGGAEREDNGFLFEGMIEILAHEYTNTSRNLEGAWVVAQLLDKIGKLGLSQQRPWPVFSEGSRSFPNAAPGVTFLTTFRELQGRDKAVRFFESLRKTSLIASLTTIFKASAPEIENIWLKRVREFQAPDEITAVAEHAPQISKAALIPESPKPGGSLEFHLFIQDPAGDLFPEGVFLKDIRTERILQGRASDQKNGEFFKVVLPIDANCPAGEYQYQVIAVDNSGNLRRWNGNYRVLAP